MDKPLVSDLDLEGILLYLENCKASGGGDISSSSLNEPNRRLITVIYSNQKAKQRVLQKRNHTFLGYNFIAYEPFSDGQFEFNNRVLIIRNLNRNEDSQELIKLYCENLVINDNEENDVESIEFSSLFKNTVYVRYKCDFEYEKKVKPRISRKSTLNNKKLVFNQAYVTRTLLLSQYNNKNQKIPQEIIDAHFLDLKTKSGINLFASTHIKEPFLLVKFNTQDECDKFLANKDLISNNSGIVIEYMHSPELLNEMSLDFKPEAPNTEVDEIKKPIEEATSQVQEQKHDNKPEQNNKPEQEEKSKLLENIVTKESRQVESVLREKPYVIMKIEQQPLLNIFNYFDNEFYEQLAKELEHEHNGHLSDLGGYAAIKIECMDNKMITEKSDDDFAILKQKWEQNVRSCLDEFFSQFELRQIKLVSSNLLEKIKYDHMRVCMTKLEKSDKSIYADLYGFKHSVLELSEKIEQENESCMKRTTEIVTVKNNGYKVHEIRLLFIIKFISTIKAKYPDLSIVMNPRDGSITMKG
jgi:hypothetical protein